jgi:YidC/Oxa1 family membrane protein insertase
MKNISILIVAGFLALCGLLIVDSGLFENSPTCSNNGCILLQQTTEENSSIEPNTPEPPAAPSPSSMTADFSAEGGPEQTIILGAQDPCTEDPEIGFKYQLELSSKGAAIRRAIFSNGNDNGFDDRDPDNPIPLEVLSPIGTDTMSMANREFVLLNQLRQMNLNQLSWETIPVQKNDDGSRTARFKAYIKDPTNETIIEVTKSYTVFPANYLLECDITINNLSSLAQQVRFNINGPLGIGREAVRADMRKVVSGRANEKGEVSSERLAINKFDGKKQHHEKPFKKNDGNFLWTAVTNKYFAAILIPVPDGDDAYCNWISKKTGRLYNPDSRKNSGDEEIASGLNVSSATLAGTNEPGSEKTYKFQLYIGPKDKSLFDKNEQYKRLGFVQTIDFMSCCCPAAMIRPLAFGILALMKWMFGFIHNYGVVIIILVFMMRIAIHPLTKKSQVTMSKMSKLAPKMEEVKKKYANNKAELQKQMMLLYREQGASPVFGMLPMFVQMPVWIALWTAVYTSIELRGEPFLPFWITDLSVPDALFSFSAVKLPLLGTLDSFNLLPIMMGFAFYLQQKLMPHTATASTRTAAENDDDYDAPDLPAGTVQGPVRRQSLYHGKYLCRSHRAVHHTKTHPGKR